MSIIGCFNQQKKKLFWNTNALQSFIVWMPYCSEVKGISSQTSWTKTTGIWIIALRLESLPPQLMFRSPWNDSLSGDRGDQPGGSLPLPWAGAAFPNPQRGADRRRASRGKSAEGGNWTHSEHFSNGALGYTNTPCHQINGTCMF